MARRELGPATLAVVQAVERVAAGPLLVACSGGADSLALAAATGIAGGRRGLAVRAVVVDHGLQPGSDQVAARVADQLAPLETTLVRVRVEVAGEGVEAAARKARYGALEQAAAPEELVLLGHTLDDQAETVLLGLARGSGTRSLAGMPARRGRFVRPLLGLRRVTTRAACAELGLEPWDDPHNAAPGFARARVRHSILPVLEAELGPGMAEALARTAELARADADLLDALASQARDRLAGEGLDAGRLAELPEALRGRVVRAWLAEAGGRDLSAAHLNAVLALVTDWHGQGPLDLPGVRVGRREGRLHASANPSGRTR
ncbi:MAG: tRNA lysidine(34) synthetase TilS [Actinobacteria bacterium]|nr:tRNA lysidine(34) synthetase TilS [Actinomycetota bacterium]